ncbi:MAG: hypothetical protein H6734_09670 [Alphaproteobacteria bacterium]|nr:hypothetical protein [Alphaproteobacteria bacterium]
MDPILQSLRALAAGVALDAGLDVVTGEPGSGWAIDPRSGTIHVDPNDLATLPEAELHGLLCHEAAHAAVTRYLWLVPPHLLREPGIAMLLNALEDCRIEDWLVKRLPGTVPWVEAYNDRLFPADGTLEGRPPFVQFCLAIVHAWWHGELPAGLHPAVTEALASTREARRAVVAEAPPVHATPTSDPAYAGSRVARVFERLGEGAVDGFEQRVRLSAARAWQRTWQDVVPVFRELVALSPPDEVKATAAAHMRAHTARWARPPTRRRTLPPVREDLLQAAVEPPPTDDWDTARRDVLPLVDALARHLEAILRPRSLPRWIGGQLAGQRVSLRAAMQREARPEKLDVWERKTLPEKPDPAFLVALDLSGSMQGAGIHWGFRGVVLVAEVLERLRLPFAIWGFQDVPIPFKSRHEPLAVARRALSGMPLEVVARRPGGHNRPEHNWDGPVLAALGARHSGTARTPVLLVVSDGAPSGPERAEEALRVAIHGLPRDVELVGIGIGPEATGVAGLYPRSVVCALEDFPVAIARCLRDALE